MKKTDSLQLVGIDLGNRFIRFADRKLYLNCLFLQNDDAYINYYNTNIKPNYIHFVDMMCLLGMRYHQPQYKSISKFYQWSLKQSSNKNVLISTNQNSSIEEYQLEYLISVTFKCIVQHSKIFMPLKDKDFKLLLSVFEGQLNHHRLALKTSLEMNGYHQTRFVNSTHCVVAEYMKGKSQMDECLMVIDFGDRGFVGGLYRIYYIDDIKIIECLDCQIIKIGGYHLTICLAELILQRLRKQLGMNTTNDSIIMHKIKILSEQAKRILTTDQTTFVRVDGLPDVQAWGCKILQKQFEQIAKNMLQKCCQSSKLLVQRNKMKPDKIILFGGSCKIPSFRSLMTKQFGQQKIVDADQFWCSQGITSIFEESTRLIDICPFELRMEADEGFYSNVIGKGQNIPIRKKIQVRFPSGQFSYTMRFYQNDELIDKDKMINIYASTSQGLIPMTTNYMKLPQNMIAQYQQTMEKLHYHLYN